MKTAVQCLVSDITSIIGKIKTTPTQHLLLIEAIQKALKTEKEQIIKAYGQGVADEAEEVVDASKEAEEYYNYTFK